MTNNNCLKMIWDNVCTFEEGNWCLQSSTFDSAGESQSRTTWMMMVVRGDDDNSGDDGDGDDCGDDDDNDGDDLQAADIL